MGTIWHSLSGHEIAFRALMPLLFAKKKLIFLGEVNFPFLVDC
jgi:hypothetical protein